MEIKEFLNPNSMLTPGVTGSTSMMITNTLTQQFEILAGWHSEVGLFVCFLFGLLVVATTTALSFWQRGVYCVLNSLIIFAVALGTNAVGMAAAKGGASSFIVVSAVYAQPRPGKQEGWCCLNEKVNPSSRRECGKWGGRLFSTKEEAERFCASTAPPEAPPQTRERKGFFKPWF